MENVFLEVNEIDGSVWCYVCLALCVLENVHKNQLVFVKISLSRNSLSATGRVRMISFNTLRQ